MHNKWVQELNKEEDRNVAILGDLQGPKLRIGEVKNGVVLKKGQKIKQGDIVGTVGSSGRATGAHLDVRLNWFDIRLDPASVLEIN